MKKLTKLSFRTAAIALLGFATCTSTFAKGEDYWNYEKGGRIALSSDGNMHDNDDMHATKMTLMILAKAQLQPNTVLYTYSDHVWGSESNDNAIMKQSAEITGANFGFTQCKFISAVSNKEAAYSSMAYEMARSTAADPLFIIAAGPMEVVGQAFDRANKTNPDALNYITIISHSDFNNNHADNPRDADEEAPHSGWTWDEMKKAFPKVNFKRIVDQNGTGSGSEVYKTKNKFAAPGWSTWYWMRDHKDKNIQRVYNHDAIASEGILAISGAAADYSDAGIAWYMVADYQGVRGDEGGNFTKLKAWIGTEVIPVVIDETKVSSVSVTPASSTIENMGETLQLTAKVLPTTAVDQSVTWSSSDEKVATVDNKGLVTSIAKGFATITVTTTDGAKIATASVIVGKAEAGDVTVGDDFISFEAESTKSPLGTNWVITTEGGAGDDNVAGLPHASGGKYIETTTGNVGGTGAVGGKDMLQYKFTPKTSGAYTLSGRMAQNLSLVTEAKKWDKCNDILLKMEGDYTSSATNVTYLQNWNKYYGRGWANNLPKWGSFVKLDVHVNGKDTKFNAIYTLKAGVEYTLSISARSKGMIIDYFLLKKGMPVPGENTDIAVLYPTTIPGVAAGGTTTPTTPVEKTITYKANEFSIMTSAAGTSIPASDFATAKLDWKDKTWLSMVERLKWGAAKITYQGGDGEVNVAINTILEKDGESTFRVFINDVKVGEVTNECIYTGPDQGDVYTVKKQVLTTEKVAIKNGDIIRVEFNSATNGKVPEDNTTATSRGRWASVVFEGEVAGGSTGGTIPTPSGDSMLDVSAFGFETPSAWKLWNVEGQPFAIVDNTAYDQATYGSKMFSFVGGGSTSTYTGGAYMNANTSDATAINGFKYQNGDQYTLHFDAKIIKAGAKVNLLFKNTENTPLDVAAAYDIITPDTPVGDWQHFTLPLANAKGVVGTLYNVNQVLLTHYMGDSATPDSYRQGEYLLDNIRVVANEGFIPAGIESATAVNALQVATDGDAIVVISNETQAINVYTISGQLIQSTTVVAGDATTVASDLAKGIYIVNNQKIVIR